MLEFLKHLLELDTNNFLNPKRGIFPTKEPEDVNAHV